MSQTRSKSSQQNARNQETKDPRDKALLAAIGEIERSYGKGSIMRLGATSDLIKEISGISTGSISLDVALGGKALKR